MGSATSLAVKKEKSMSEKNQIVVVLIVALFLGAFVDRATALKIVAGVALLWTLQNQPTVFECIRKAVLASGEGRFSVREYRGGLQEQQGCLGIDELARQVRLERFPSSPVNN
jgi:hypothetical protein